MTLTPRLHKPLYILVTKFYQPFANLEKVEKGPRALSPKAVPSSWDPRIIIVVIVVIVMIVMASPHRVAGSPVRRRPTKRDSLWDIIDEGPMEDLLGIECNTNPDGSITLHQNKYINSMINRFFTPEEREGFKKASTPYATNLAQLVIEALEGSTASEPGYPDLVKEYQRMVGSLMYCCTATRPDLAYAVHQH